MEIETEKKGNALVVNIKEEKIEIGNSIEFREELTKLADAKCEQYVLNMNNVQFIDSSGIGVLISFYHFCQDGNKELKLACCGQKVKDTLKTTKLDSKMPVFDSVDSAIA